MTLTPIDEVHAAQIQAGILGRRAGHAFEDEITERINKISYPFCVAPALSTHVRTGDPARLLLDYVCSAEGIKQIEGANALSTGALATSEAGRNWLDINGANVRRCKSDLVLTLNYDDSKSMTVGISTKQCNNSSPTNAQLYFTTAVGFSSLLTNNGLSVSAHAVTAMRQFCGDVGFKPSDDPSRYQQRQSDPRRFFWEEINEAGRYEWETLFFAYQDEITRLMLQKAYYNDPFIPTYLLHKTRRSSSWNATEIAVYTMDELIAYSRAYGGVSTKNYSVRKGRFRDPSGIVHAAPRFGIVQMQRGGQAQHPSQLQFNLEAGYFYKLKQFRPDMPS